MKKKRKLRKDDLCNLSLPFISGIVGIKIGFASVKIGFASVREAPGVYANVEFDFSLSWIEAQHITFIGKDLEDLFIQIADYVRNLRKLDDYKNFV